jgi:hypothetical protein
MVALIAVARKLLTILNAILRDGHAPRVAYQAAPSPLRAPSGAAQQKHIQDTIP